MSFVLKVTTAERDAFTPKRGDQIFNIDADTMQFFNGTNWSDFGGEGTTSRLTTVRSLDLVLDGTEQIIAFDPAQTSREIGLSVTVGGNVLAGVDGYFSGILSLFVNKSGGAGADLAIWLEIKPIATGIWELASASMANPIFFDDGGQAVAFSGVVDVLDGDEIRVKIKEQAGSATLETSTLTTALGDVSQFAASLSMFKIGPVTP